MLDAETLAKETAADPLTKTAKWRDLTIMVHPVYRPVIIDAHGIAGFLKPADLPSKLMLPKQEHVSSGEFCGLPVNIDKLVPDGEAWLVDPNTGNTLATIKIVPQD